LFVRFITTTNRPGNGHFQAKFEKESDMSFLRSVSAASVAIALCVAWSPAASASTISISQTSSFVVTGTSSPVSINWQQFDPSLGQLTDVLFSISGSASGSFSLTNIDPEFAISLSNPRDRLRFIFSGVGAPATITSPQTVLSTISPAMPFTVNPETSSTFTLTSPQTLTAVSDSSLLSAQSYFTGVGTVASTVNQAPLLTQTTDGSSGTENYSNLSADGTVTLTYVYAVPEPPAIMLAGLGVMGIVFADRSRRLRRSRATATGDDMADDSNVEC